MRHRAKTHSFNRRQGPRIALIRGLVYSLVEHGRIKTTLAKAKEVRRHVEKAVTLGKKGTLHSRRVLLSRYPNEKVVDALSTDLKKRFDKRDGGYTRIVKIGPRQGDQADVAFLEFVDFQAPEASTPEAVKGTPKTAKKKVVKAKTAGAEKTRKKARKTQSAARRSTKAKKTTKK